MLFIFTTPELIRHLRQLRTIVFFDSIKYSMFYYVLCSTWECGLLPYPQMLYLDRIQMGKIVHYKQAQKARDLGLGCLLVLASKA
jgi:hypothetical protein